MGMSETLVTSKAMKSEGALSRFHIVKFGADDDHVALAAASTDALLGVVQNDAGAAEEQVRVMVIGISRVKLGGAVTRGDFVTADSSGQGVAAARHTHTENTEASYTQNTKTDPADASNAVGRALKSGVAGDIVPVILMPAAI